MWSPGSTRTCSSGSCCSSVEVETVTAELLIIGNELVDGTRSDTNGARIAKTLRGLGIPVSRTTLVPDEPDDVEAALREAIERADLVLTTGGLGPTSDDRTKQIAARVFGSKLVLDESVLSDVRSRFEERGLTMPEINVSQAMVPEGARIIPNRVGTAPGFALESKGTTVFLMPGVPAEMNAMLREYVAPFLEGRGHRRLEAERVLRTTGLPESEIASRVEKVARRLARTEISFLPSILGVEVRIVGRGDSPGAARQTADRAADRLAELIGDAVYAREAQSLEEVVGYLLTMQRRSLAVAESCTGGGVGRRITSVPGSSDYFAGGVIAYSNDIKKRVLGVRAGTLRTHGAVSEETAVEMADGVLKRCRSDIGLSITGIAGPGGGTDDKPVGLVWLGIAGLGDTTAGSALFAGDRDAVRRQAEQAALDAVRLRLAGG
ncbi:MAG: competence/damage-inducible protein A [Candidatus Eisenbacteria bacterium]|nr:competence/damage-inducible protein A [Candidatus Eisenbacteria bacterium]